MFRGGGRGRGGNAGGWRGGGSNFRGGRGGQQHSGNSRYHLSNLPAQSRSSSTGQSSTNQQPNNRSSGGNFSNQQQTQQPQNRTPQQPAKVASPQTTPKPAGTPKQTPQKQQTGEESAKPQTPGTPLNAGLPQRDSNKGKAPSLTVPPTPPAAAAPQNGAQKQTTPQSKSAAQVNAQKPTQSGAQDQNRPSGASAGVGRTTSQATQQDPGGAGLSSDDPNAENTKLFIATVKQGISDKEFRELFSKFGKLKDVYLNKNKWFGLVTFETHDDANSARKHYLNSNILKLKWAQATPKETPLILNQSNADQPPQKKESSSKCRLFIGNLAPDVSPDNIRKLFEPYGTIMELFVPSGKGFGFVRYETRASAEAAKSALEGEPFANRQLQIRFASQGAVLKVRNLSPFVTNELLHQAFEPFGELERATVFVDERGKSLGEGILEFSRKPVAVAVMRKAQQECLLLTTSPLPVIIEPMELRDDEDGFSEKMINKQSTGYMKDREKGPRFAEKGTFEFEFAMKWKELLALERLKKEQMERELQLERARLMEEMDIMRYDYDVETLRRRLKLLEGRQEEFENRKLAAEKNNKAREEELKAMQRTITKRQAEILGYPYEDDEEDKLLPPPQQQGNPNQQLMSGHPVADAVLGAALVVPPSDQQPSAVAENFLKQWNSITKGVPPDQQQGPPQGNSKMPGGQMQSHGPPNRGPPGGNNWHDPQMSPANKGNCNKPAYISYLGQNQPNGKRLSDPGPVSKRRRY